MATYPAIVHDSAATQRMTERNIHAQYLLTALVGFMQPIIQVSVSSIETKDLDIKEHSAGEQPVANEGEKLLVALESFIVATVRKQSPSKAVVHTEMEDLLNNHQMPDTVNLEYITPSFSIQIPAQNEPAPTVTQPPSAQTEEIRRMILDEVHAHVYSKMPMRLLAFGPSGVDPVLVDRTEIRRRVLERTHSAAEQPAFVLEWEKAHKLAQMDPLPTSSSGISNSWQSIPNQSQKESAGRKERLILNLVADHARYAILSHTWIRDAPGDVVFQDWASRNSNFRGNEKIDNFCEVAAKDHSVEFGWMDTVCIDKASSSELDESIRSMYKWYRGAYVCIAYLSETETPSNMQRDSWFTRAWTLQELLAPRHIRFYNKHWVDFLHMARDTATPQFFPVGHWTSANIQDKIEEATGITPRESGLCKLGEIDKIPISRRLKLVSTRQVTREEDIVYSVMGLLGVDIPVAYGEGSEVAFFRLVRELLSTKKTVLDIFNYGYDYPQIKSYPHSPKLIPCRIQQYFHRSPSFDTPAGIFTSILDQWTPLEPVVLTHRGVRIQVLLASALRREGSKANKNYIPKGDFSGSVQMAIVMSGGRQIRGDYNLLDRGEIPSFKVDSNDVPTVVSFAILNFMTDNNDNILLPPWCLAIPLNSHPSVDGMTIIPTTHPAEFKIKSFDNRNTVPCAELENHGLRVETLYL